MNEARKSDTQIEAPPARAARRKGDRFWSQGEPLVWVAGGALATVLMGALTLLLVVLYNGLGVFWPARIEQVQLADGKHFLGRRLESQSDPQRGTQVRFKTANREFHPDRQDFRWVAQSDIVAMECPADVTVLERQANGDFYGVLRERQSARAGTTREQRPGRGTRAGRCSRPCGQSPSSGLQGSIRSWIELPP